jgi:hypothetical protein
MLSVVLIGVGCSTGPGVNCEATTSHDSCVYEGVDEALVGTWTLESQSINASVGTITNPSSGRTLTILNDGSYTEDYSTETIPDKTVSGITSSCDISGVLTGDYEVQSDLDLDQDPPPVVNQLLITPNGGSPTVKCGAGGTSIKANTASSPLGVGPATGTPPYVVYTYTMNDDWTTLTIIQNNTIANITNTYVFTR